MNQAAFALLLLAALGSCSGDRAAEPVRGGTQRTELTRGGFSLVGEARRPSIRTLGNDAFRMSAAPSFEPYAFIVEFTRADQGGEAAAELIEFEARDSGVGPPEARVANAIRTPLRTYRFSVPGFEYDAMMGRIDALLAGWKGNGENGTITFCVDGTATEFERKEGQRILSLENPCGSGAPDLPISIEVLRVLHKYGPSNRLPYAADWFGRNMSQAAMRGVRSRAVDQERD